MDKKRDRKAALEGTRALDQQDRRYRNLSMSVVRKLAAGTPLREGIDRIVDNKTGGFVVYGLPKAIRKKVAGNGDKIRAAATATKLAEYARLEMAMVLSKGATRIVRTNTKLEPPADIQPLGTYASSKHPTADRVAQAHPGTVAIALSEERTDAVTVFHVRRHAVTPGSEEMVDTMQVLHLPRQNELAQHLHRQTNALRSVVADLGEIPAALKRCLQTNEVVRPAPLADAIGEAVLVLKRNPDLIRGFVLAGDQESVTFARAIKHTRAIDQSLSALLRTCDRGIAAQGDRRQVRRTVHRLMDLTDHQLMNSRQVLKVLGWDTSPPSGSAPQSGDHVSNFDSHVKGRLLERSLTMPARTSIAALN